MRKINYKFRNYVNKLMDDESGMGVVEIVLIILVLVGLAFLFKNNITSVVSDVIVSIKTQVQSF